MPKQTQKSNLNEVLYYEHTVFQNSNKYKNKLLILKYNHFWSWFRYQKITRLAIIHLVNNLENLFQLPFALEVLLFEHFSSLEDFSYFDKLQFHGISHQALFLLGQVPVSPAKQKHYQISNRKSLERTRRSFLSFCASSASMLPATDFKSESNFCLSANASRRRCSSSVFFLRCSIFSS